ncbi:uncharacterized protein LOC135811373 [Sycon ciliatum]|uniref:uncharacterized protein LOC135811373 n=1 Tax=Sycon ciliatum TaxID=27933 RepID=UPI0031F65FA0
MTSWLRHSFPNDNDQSTRRYEQLMGEFLPPVDQRTLSTTSKLLLSAILGGDERVSRFATCADGQCEHPSPCQHGGKCVYASVDGNTPQLKQYKCQCRPGYAGRQCELVVSACITRRPCMHGGRCERSGSHHYVCHCPPFYYGQQCQHRFGIEEFENMTSSMTKFNHRLNTVEKKSARASQRNANTITTFLRRLEARLSTRLDTQDAKISQLLSQKQATQEDLNNTRAMQVQVVSDLRAKDRTLEAMFTTKLAEQGTKISHLTTGQQTMQRQLNQRMDNGLASVRQQQTALMNSRISQSESRSNQNMDSRLGQLETELNQRMDDRDSHLQMQVKKNSLKLASSCKEIQQLSDFTASSGMYRIVSLHLGNTSFNEVYCDMDHYGGGWTRIAYINPTQQGSCPGNMRFENLQVNLCTMPSGPSCHGASFQSPIESYSEVMGFVTGYRDQTLDAFYVGSTDYIPLHSWYMDGVSVTYGSPMRHLWTYTASFDNASAIYHCPCSPEPGPQPPSFVGSHYYCADNGDAGHSLQPTMHGATRVNVLLVGHVVTTPICHGFIVNLTLVALMKYRSGFALATALTRTLALMKLQSL